MIARLFAFSLFLCGLMFALALSLAFRHFAVVFF